MITGENGEDNGHRVFASDNSDAFETWKRNIKDDFCRWIDDLTPEKWREQEEQRDCDTPDLWSFYTALEGLRSETRTLSRKTAESVNRVNEVLSQALDQKSSREAPEEPPFREWVPALLGLIDRIGRILDQLHTPPKKRTLFTDRRWPDYHARITEAVTLFDTHLREMIDKLNIRRIPASGEPFDPRIMEAVEVRIDPSLPDNRVVEELRAGYMYGDMLIRLAEVIVSRTGNTVSESGGG